MVLIVLAPVIRPPTITIRREAVILAAPQPSAPFLQDFRRSKDRTPQDRDDPAKGRTFSGVAREPGAVSERSGNGPAGESWIEVTQVYGPAEVTVKVGFRRPFQARDLNRFIPDSRGADSPGSNGP